MKQYMPALIHQMKHLVFNPSDIYKANKVYLLPGIKDNGSQLMRQRESNQILNTFAFDYLLTVKNY
jgi:hypothetical protein